MARPPQIRNWQKPNNRSDTDNTHGKAPQKTPLTPTIRREGLVTTLAGNVDGYNYRSVASVSTKTAFAAGLAFWRLDGFHCLTRLAGVACRFFSQHRIGSEVFGGIKPLAHCETQNGRSRDSHLVGELIDTRLKFGGQSDGYWIHSLFVHRFLIVAVFRRGIKNSFSIWAIY
jgi:hypothetical protein